MATESVLHPSLIVPIGHVEPVPRRIRGLVGGRVAFDTRRALYVWEWQAYPQFSIPVEDLVEGVLDDDKHTEQLGAGPAHRHTLRVGPEVRAGAAWVWGEGSPEALRDTVRFEWEALDAWFEEDEPVFVHPRSPYSRVDALRSRSTRGCLQYERERRVRTRWHPSCRRPSVGEAPRPDRLRVSTLGGEVGQPCRRKEPAALPAEEPRE